MAVFCSPKYEQFEFYKDFQIGIEAFKFLQSLGTYYTPSSIQMFELAAYIDSYLAE